ncbi:cytochrome P450 2M1-like [Sardina pilchardus]|uniref:cytochrome P450 2M1-like n=1 Tax=Sardina pilchardus TaxID=27697 RepID=UPI002E0D561C
MDALPFLQTSHLLLFLVGVISALLVWKNRGRPTGFERLPPGPPPIPVLGNILQIDIKQPYKTYMELSQRFGPVCTIWLGPKPVVILSGLQTLRDALVTQGEEFSDRAAYPMSMKITRGYGILASNGHRWREIRRYAVTTLKNFGMGQRSIEQRVQEEARSLVKAFAEHEGAVFQPSEDLGKAVSNIICSIVFGQRFEYDDPDFLMLYSTVCTYFHVLCSPIGMLYNIFPGIMEYLPGKHRHMFAMLQKFREYVRRQSDIRLKHLDANSTPRDYMEAFLIKVVQEKDAPNSEFHYNNLLGSVWSLFSAGTETTSSSLRQMLLLMIKYPQIQARVQEEIDEVIGQDRSPSMEDRLKMPYTDAVIHEAQRNMDIAPISVPHKVAVNTEFKNYYIPKDTTVFPLLSSVLYDPRLWKNPNNFDPENFLDEEGRFKKNDGFVAFGLGRRVCLGEGLARTELFLFTCSLLQRFTFVGTRPAEEIDTNPTCSSFGRMPRTYQCYAKPRA